MTSIYCGAPTSGRWAPRLSGRASEGSISLTILPPNMTAPSRARKSAIRFSTSGRKCRIKPWMGHAAASPNAQIVRPSTCLLYTVIIISIGRGKKKGGRDARQLQKHVDLALVSTALDKTVHHVHHPCGAFSAWRALATRLVFVELQADVRMSRQDDNREHALARSEQWQQRCQWICP